MQLIHLGYLADLFVPRVSGFRRRLMRCLSSLPFPQPPPRQQRALLRAQHFPDDALSELELDHQFRIVLDNAPSAINSAISPSSLKPGRIASPRETSARRRRALAGRSGIADEVPWRVGSLEGHTRRPISRARASARPAPRRSEGEGAVASWQQPEHARIYAHNGSRVALSFSPSYFTVLGTGYQVS